MALKLLSEKQLIKAFLYILYIDKYAAEFLHKTSFKKSGNVMLYVELHSGYAKIICPVCKQDYKRRNAFKALKQRYER